ncbi:MAG: hypothetical protein AB2598_09920 [Candidatus Thiodiazotropha sp.]
MVNQAFNRFSVRRLNPFNGILQVFSGENGRALSSNGVVWEIQVLSDTPQGLWANTPFSGKQFYTFGRWAAESGLQQVPVNPLFNVRDMIASVEQLIPALSSAVETLPFPPADDHELWLLDERRLKPIALLASCQNSAQLDRGASVKWIAAGQGDLSFVSPTLLGKGVVNNDGYNPRVHASILEATVRGHGDQRLRQAWFRHDPDGIRTPCEPSEVGGGLSAFPPLPITEDWENDQERCLVADYIAWKAPQLLQLPGIDPTLRARLEKIAVSQAEVVERLWRLYPEIHNKDLLNSARVEARIRSANRK